MSAAPRPSGAGPLWAGLVASLVGVLLALALARYLRGPGWVYALWGVGAALGLGAALVLGLVLQRLDPVSWSSWVALALACGAAAGRLALRLTPPLEGALPPTIDLPRVAIASGSVAWGLMALLWGTHGLAQQLEAPAAPGGRRWPASIAAGLAVVLALHSAAPFWRLLGLEINHWTVGGLFGLAATAYAIELGYRRLRRR